MGFDHQQTLDASALQRVRAAHSSVKILHVSGALPSWRQVLAPSRRKAFKEAIRHYGSLWCAPAGCPCTSHPIPKPHRCVVLAGWLSIFLPPTLQLASI